jgi:SAM-dependent methyltransferase
MEEVKPWYEEDFFWETVAPVLFGEQRWSDAPTDVENALTLLGISPGASVLDLCCGVGRHSLELARRGIQVTAVDRTSAYLERARKQAEQEGLDIEFVQDDMRTFCRPGAFDAVVNLFTSFGYFDDPEDDRQVVLNVHESLKPGGIFLMDMAGKEIAARVFQERGWREEDAVIILEERKVTNNWGRMDNRWIILKGGEKQEFRLSLRLYSAVELSTLLGGCGFDKLDVYGDMTGSPYDHMAKRLVVVAHKGRGSQE